MKCTKCIWYIPSIKYILNVERPENLEKLAEDADTTRTGDYSGEVAKISLGRLVTM